MLFTFAMNDIPEMYRSPIFQRNSLFLIINRYYMQTQQENDKNN